VEKRPVGRPPYSINNLPENWKQILIDMKKEGKADVEVIVALDMSKNDWYSLLETNEEFSETVRKAQVLCEAWWVDIGRKGMVHTSGGKDVHKNLNPALYMINMKNRFGWRNDPEPVNQLQGKIITLELQ
jgi:hypothetical protein